MSLLVATENDYRDAHINIKNHGERYKHEYFKIKHEKLANGQFKYGWDFEIVDGFFKQSEMETNDLKFNYANEDLGLITDWNQTIHKIRQLNFGSDSDTSYKLIFFARHGQGLHNFAVAKYGDEEWERKWHLLGSDGEITWGPDPKLTELGINQARENNRILKQQISRGMPIPSLFYCSPLLRSCQTLQESWEDIEIPRPVITELIRETCGRSLCHKRSSRHSIVERYPNWLIDENVTLEDQLFDLHNGETLYENQIIMKYETSDT